MHYSKQAIKLGYDVPRGVTNMAFLQVHNLYSVVTPSPSSVKQFSIDALRTLSRSQLPDPVSQINAVTDHGIRRRAATPLQSPAQLTSDRQGQPHHTTGQSKEETIESHKANLPLPDDVPSNTSGTGSADARSVNGEIALLVAAHPTL